MIAAAAARKIGAVETVAEFLGRRAVNAKLQNLTRYLDDAPKAPRYQGTRCRLFDRVGCGPNFTVVCSFIRSPITLRGFR